MFTSGPSLSFSYFFLLFIHSAFPLCSFLLYILLQDNFLFLPSVVDLSLCTVYQLVDRIFSCYFGMSSFVCIVWPCLSTFWVFLLFLIFWFISSSCIVRLVCGCLFRVCSFHWVPVCFTSLCSFACCQFLYLSFWPHFLSRFCISVQISLVYTYFITD